MFAIRTVFIVLLACAPMGPILHAQTPTEQATIPPIADEAAIDAEKIAKLQEEAKNTADLTEQQQKDIAELAQQVLNDLKAKAAVAQKLGELKKETAAIGQEQERVTQELTQLEQAGDPKVENGLTLSDLDLKRNEFQQSVTELEQQLTLPSVDPAARSAQRKVTRQFLIDLPQKLQENQQQLQAPNPEGEPSVLSQIRQASLRVKRQLMQQKEIAAQNELSLYDAEDAVKLPALKRELRTRKLNRTRKLVELYLAEVNRLRQEEAEARVREARIAKMQAEPLLEPILSENQDIATEETEVRRLHEAAQESLKEVEAQLRTLLDDQAEIAELDKQQLGLSGAMGLRLRKMRAHVPSIRTNQAERAARLETLETAEYTLYERRDALDDLLDIEAAAEKVIQDSDVTGAQLDELRDNTLSALRSQQDYLENVVNAYNKYTETLTTLDEKQKVLIDEARELTSLVDQRILWIRSHRPISISEFLEDRDSITALWNIEAWQAVSKAFLRDVRQVPWLLTVAGLTFVMLMVMHQRVGRRLRDIAKVAESGRTVSFMPTVHAVEYTILVSLIWPGVLWFLAWRLMNTPDQPRLVLAAAVSMNRLAWIFLLLELVRQSLRPNGVCESHFGWPKSTLRATRARLRKLMIIGLPLAAAIAVIHFHDGEGRRAVIERLLYMALMGVLCWFAHSLLHPRTGALRELRELHSGGWLDRLKGLWYALAVGLPLTLGILAAVGYYYSAQKLMAQSQITLFLVLGGFYIRALSLRWVMLRHRRLKIQQLHERRAALAATSSSDETGASLPEVTEELADLSNVSLQSQRLISTTLILVGLICLWLVWHNVVPAVRYLDRWPLWPNVVQVYEQIQQEDGTFKTEIRLDSQSITVANLAFACIILSLTVTAARNLPGLLEIALLQRLPIDRSTAYAITALVRYGLVLIGIMAASRTMGIGWAKVQWLAAALTFGLGFGLQEIFANFVSGIIILFEQPVRVGDVVTIDGVSGVVNRIRIRATTIVDWDRKEYIVPNREFITGRLLNWTLSDKMNRLVINIGVAYGSDTSLVREVILQVAREHENVLEDPGPLVTFEAFGDSSLNFVLRAYLPNLDNRLQTIHDLHATINDRLAANHIQIPFPQRDLHVRSTVRIDESHSPSSNGHNGSLKHENVSSES